jgi:hypothetical protein
MAKQSSDSAKTSTNSEAASGSTRRYPSRIPRIFQGNDPEAVQAEIRNVYGHNVSRAFAADLLAFVEKAMRGEYHK